jgi:hypothetical protein
MSVETWRTYDASISSAGAVQDMRSRKGTRGLVSHAPLLIPISASDPLRQLAGWYWPEFWVTGLSRQQLSPERPGHKSLAFRRRGAGENRRVWGSRYRRGSESQGSQWTPWWEQDPNPRPQLRWGSVQLAARDATMRHREARNADRSRRQAKKAPPDAWDESAPTRRSPTRHTAGVEGAAVHRTSSPLPGPWIYIASVQLLVRRLACA